MKNQIKKTQKTIYLKQVEEDQKDLVNFQK